jgi:hypothetical protein
VFASAERNLVFGINDFDETLPGPWEWDVKRLAASAVVAARFLGGDKVTCEDSARAAVRSYRKRMREFAQMRYLDVWYSRIDERGIMKVLPPEVRRGAQKIIDKAKTRGHVQVLNKMAELGRQFPSNRRTGACAGRETHTSDGQLIADVVAKVWEQRHRIASGRRKRSQDASGSSMSHARSWALEASARDAGFCCSRATVKTIRCFFSTRKHSPQCCRPT